MIIKEWLEDKIMQTVLMKSRDVNNMSYEHLNNIFDLMMKNWT